MPLSLSNIGEDLMIKQVLGKPEIKKHLADLGFIPGGSVKVISKIAGNVIVNVKQTRVAISKEMANKIIV